MPVDPVVESLLREREGYVRRNQPERVAAVDEALSRFGHRVDSTAPEAAVAPPRENAVRPKSQPRRSAR